MTVIALPEAQETADVPCDTGSDVGPLKHEMEGKPVDLSRVMEGWNSKTGRWAPTAGALEKRAREARQWLKARPEKEIVLVTHGGFLHYFTEDWTDYNKTMGTNRSSRVHRAIWLSILAQVPVGQTLNAALIISSTSEATMRR